MGFRLEREMRFAGSRRGTTLKLGQSYLGAHSRYQALFVLAIRYVDGRPKWQNTFLTW